MACASSRCTTWSAYRRIGEVKCVYVGSASPLCSHCSRGTAPERKYFAGAMQRVEMRRTRWLKCGSAGFVQAEREAASSCAPLARKGIPCCSSARARAANFDSSGCGWRRSSAASGHASATRLATAQLARTCRQAPIRVRRRAGAGATAGSPQLQRTMNSSMSECAACCLRSAMPVGRLIGPDASPSSIGASSNFTSDEARKSAPLAALLPLSRTARRPSVCSAAVRGSGQPSLSSRSCASA
mmetsp:Transcript_30234/g.90197  ORF Transcript_30234/g.90197 Transcript_30234/m.90197 type:complete len:242 (-) Transcript_30234:599-1324(-)